MAAIKHQQIQIQTENGETVMAQAPIIVSASRSTDIPAFYADWFFHRLDVGYSTWTNPFNGVRSYVSYQNTRFIVFWSKNPRPLIQHLSELEQCGIGCYIQYTVNDYEAEGLEKCVPSLNERIETFKELVECLSMGHVIWRFDPLVLTDQISIDTLLAKIENIGDRLLGYTEKLVFSFADINVYKKVVRNLREAQINYIEWDEDKMIEFAGRLAEMNAIRWGYKLATCSEAISLEQFGIEHNRCIDPELISRLRPKDAILHQFLYSARRDAGQRKWCGCILSKDIGSYNTCTHGCQYCYANTSVEIAKKNHGNHNPLSESII